MTMMRRLWLVLLLVGAGAISASAQSTTIRRPDGTETGTSTTPLRVDPTGATTQPVSAASLPLPTGAATATLQGVVDADDASIATGQTATVGLALSQAYDGSVWRRLTFGTAGTAATQVWTIQGIAGMTKLLVTPDSVALPANQSVNVNQLAGTTTDTNSGNKSAGTLRVVLATDQPALTNKLLVTPDSVALPANQSVNESQINGVTPLMGNGLTGTGSQRVTIASDNTAFAVNGTLQTQTDTVMVGGVNIKEINAVTPLMGNGATGTGALRVSIANDSTGVVQPGNTANTTPWLMSPGANTSSTLAASGCYLQSAASTNATNCKASAGNFYGFSAVNTTATLYYLRMYNLGSAPTCSSATGFINTYPIPASTTGSGIVRITDIPVNYGTGIGFCFTGGGSSTDNTNAATGVYVEILYK